jgi:integrase
MRFSLVRQFLTYLKAFMPETEIPTAILVNARRPRPLLFSEEQIAAIQAATAKLWPAGSLQQITLETLLGLLASTGLRVGEALRLTIPDVQLDQEPPRLEIRHTKFRKSRFVPVHPTTADRLRNYLRQRSKLAGAGSSQFFLRAPNQPLNYKTALNSFGRLRRLLGIPKLPGRRGPAFHTLRHSFAVRRLVSWYCAGRDVRNLLPHLAVYLGHLSLIQSSHYLTATPELLTAAAERFAEYAQSGGCQ